MHVIFRIGSISRDESFPGIPQDMANPITWGHDHVPAGITHKAIPALARVLGLPLRIVAMVRQPPPDFGDPS